MKPNKLALTIALIGFVLRFGFGLFSFSYLPSLTEGSEPQKAGYLFFDAYHRDTQAWQLATSESPLMNAFSEKQSSDQYGGLLWLLAAIYRATNLGVHTPALTIFFSALASSIGIYFLFLIAKILFSAKHAMYLAAAAALFPEFILLGASQMREPYLIALVSVFFWGVLNFQKSKNYLASIMLVLSAAGLLLISPGILALVVLLVGGWVAFDPAHFNFSLRKLAPLLLAGAILFFISLIILTASWNTLVSYNGGGIIGTLSGWARRTAIYNAYLLKQSSGIVQVVLSTLPQALALPFIAIYGLLQPVMPAVIFEPGELFWKIVGFFRSFSWYLLLPLLMFFPFTYQNSHINTNTQRKQWVWIYLVSVSWLFISSIRAGGDQWDNPRYRVILLPILLLLATYAIDNINTKNVVWLKKIFTIEVFNLLLFTHWYSWRYAGIGFDLGIRNTILLGILGSLLILFSDMLKKKVFKTTRV